MNSSNTRPVPGPGGHWLLGNLPEFRSDMLGFLTGLRDQYGPIAKFRLGPRSLVFISDPQLIQQVLVTRNKQFRKHYATRLLTPVLGRGLLTSEGESWLRQRRLIQPAFCRRFADEFIPTVIRHTENLATCWHDSQQRDLYQDMTHLTVQIAAEAFLGVQDECETESLGDALEIVHTDFENRFQQAWKLPTWLPTRRNRRLQSAVASLTTVIDRMIQLRRSDVQDRHDALSLLLRAIDQDGNRMSQQQLRDEFL